MPGPQAPAPPARALDRTLPHLAHLTAALFLFSGALLGGGMFFFRDVAGYYYPEYVFLHRALRLGVWPLWDPTINAGTPCLMAYPVDLLLVALTGPRGALALSPPLHALLAACGLTLLGRRLGLGAWGAWAAGACYAFSGYFLSQSFFPNFYAAAWAPWVVVLAVDLVHAPSRRRVALLATLAALETSTLGGEVALQTPILALCLLPRMPGRRDLVRLAAAGALAILLLAPVLMGTRALLEGTRRGQGFGHDEAFSYSASPLVLVESLLPRFFGDIHAFSRSGYWGQSFFQSGYPYLPSLYVGLGVLLLALLGGRRKLWIPVALGVLLSLGDRGPLGVLLVPVLSVFRVPVKFLFLSVVPLALLAGSGLDRLARGALRPRPWVLLPGGILLATSAVLTRRPGLPAALLGGLVPALADPSALQVVRDVWPGQLALTGALCLGAGLAAWAGPRVAPLAGVLVLCDLLRVNFALNPTTDASFYDLQPAVKAAVESAAARGSFRWFSYGAALSPGLRFSPEVVRSNSDVWLYAMDRQSLLPRANVLDGLDSAFELDEMGLAPEGAALPFAESYPARYRDIHRRLRLANVRWVVSFLPLPEDLLALDRTIPLRAVEEPLRLYELRDALPRAFWVPACEVVADHRALAARLESADFDPTRLVLLDREPPGPAPAPSGGEAPATVRYERIDPHTVRIDASSPSGFIVVLDGFHRDWRALGPEGPEPLLRGDGRYWALPTPGGARRYLLRYEPAWRAPALALAGAAALLALALGRASART